MFFSGLSESGCRSLNQQQQKYNRLKLSIQTSHNTKLIHVEPTDARRAENSRGKQKAESVRSCLFGRSMPVQTERLWTEFVRLGLGQSQPQRGGQNNVNILEKCIYTETVSNAATHVSQVLFDTS